MLKSRSVAKLWIFKTAAMITLMAQSSLVFSQTAEERQFHDLMFPYGAQNTSQTPKIVTKVQRDSELSVRTRRSPSYDPQNIVFGSFIVAPSIETSGKFISNVYAAKNNPKEDFVLSVRPEINLKSNFIRHMLNGNFYFEDGKYKKLGAEDYKDYGAQVDARYDAYAGLSLPLSIGYSRGHSRRDDPEDRNVIDPLVFDVANAQTGLKMTGDRIEVTALSGVQNIAYYDTTASGGARVDNGDRDRTVFANSVTVGLPQEAVIAPYVYGSYKVTTFDKKRDRFGLNRDSSDVEGGIGSYFNANEVVQSNFKIGNVHRDFDDSTLDPVDALTYFANLNWDATTLAAFSLTGERFIRETSTSSSSQIQSSARLGMVYELAPNIFLNPQIGYIQRDYKQSDFKSKAYTGDLQAIYKLNPNVWTTLEYNGIREKEGNGGAFPNGYDNDTVTLSLKLQL